MQIHHSSSVGWLQAQRRHLALSEASSKSCKSCISFRPDFRGGITSHTAFSFPLLSGSLCVHREYALPSTLSNKQKWLSACSQRVRLTQVQMASVFKVKLNLLRCHGAGQVKFYYLPNTSNLWLASLLTFGSCACRHTHIHHCWIQVSFMTMLLSTWTSTVEVGDCFNLEKNLLLKYYHRRAPAVKLSRYECLCA